MALSLEQGIRESLPGELVLSPRPLSLSWGRCVFQSLTLILMGNRDLYPSQRPRSSPAAAARRAGLWAA